LEAIVIPDIISPLFSDNDIRAIAEHVDLKDENGDLIVLSPEISNILNKVARYYLFHSDGYQNRLRLKKLKELPEGIPEKEKPAWANYLNEVQSLTLAKLEQPTPSEFLTDLNSITRKAGELIELIKKVRPWMFGLKPFEAIVSREIIRLEMAREWMLQAKKCFEYSTEKKQVVDLRLDESDPAWEAFFSKRGYPENDLRNSLVWVLADLFERGYEGKEATPSEKGPFGRFVEATLNPVKKVIDEEPLGLYGVQNAIKSAMKKRPDPGVALAWIIRTGDITQEQIKNLSQFLNTRPLRAWFWAWS
jgi:hypothetical protein